MEAFLDKIEIDKGWRAHDGTRTLEAANRSEKDALVSVRVCPVKRPTDSELSRGESAHVDPSKNRARRAAQRSVQARRRCW